MKRNYMLAVVALLFLLTMGTSIASADTVSYTLGIGNPAILGYSGPYATVSVNRTDSTHATITFTSLTNGGNIYLMGDGGTAGVNVNATSWTLGTITGSNSGTGFTPGPYTNGGAGNEDGFGRFNQTINSFDGFKSSSNTLSFVLTDTSGSWAAANQVLIANTDGYLAAAHIFVTTSSANARNGALATGYATNGTTTVPDGGMTLMLLGGALVGLEALRRKFRI